MRSTVMVIMAPRRTERPSIASNDKARVLPVMEEAGTGLAVDRENDIGIIAIVTRCNTIEEVVEATEDRLEVAGILVEVVGTTTTIEVEVAIMAAEAEEEEVTTTATIDTDDRTAMIVRNPQLDTAVVETAIARTRGVPNHAAEVGRNLLVAAARKTDVIAAIPGRSRLRRRSPSSKNPSSKAPIRS